MKITPLKVLRIDANKTLRPSVAFQFTECPRTGSKKVSVGLGSGKISRTQLQLSEEWIVWRTQLQLSEECGKQYPGLIFLQDNARSHTARVAMSCLIACQILPWPVRFFFNRACLGYNGKATASTREGVAFLGFWTVRTILNPISGQDFDEGHDESGVLHSARWHDDDWMIDGIREAWLRLDEEFSKFFYLAESLVTAL
ncbi:uncharacterized protein TNCV_2635261 [Trichonephila clavipes]|nr:uncharacterized protein TNCV_2635261 [Trichonephila clavipes]